MTELFSSSGQTLDSAGAIAFFPFYTTTVDMLVATRFSTAQCYIAVVSFIYKSYATSCEGYVGYSGR